MYQLWQIELNVNYTLLYLMQRTIITIINLNDLRLSTFLGENLGNFVLNTT